MFLNIKKQGYTQDGGQFAHGYFLVLCQPLAPETMSASEQVKYTCNAPIKAFVCYARMGQLGQFMMANVKVKGEKIVLSGTYGNDGLTRDVPQKVYDAAIDLPAELVEKWKNGGGWNSAGNEANDMRTWAKKAFKIS